MPRKAAGSCSPSGSPSRPHRKFRAQFVSAFLVFALVPGSEAYIRLSSYLPREKILGGKSVDDESMLTGESLPVFKENGMSVSAGIIIWDGPWRIEASTTGAMSTISKIICMVEDAQAQEAPIQRLADSIAGPFVYSVMTLSAATFIFWYYFGAQIFP